MPDFFHCMHDLVKSYALPIGQRLRQAHQELPARLGRERRPEQVMEIIYDAQAALMDQACRSRGPGEVIPLFARARERMLREAAATV